MIDTPFTEIIKSRAKITTYFTQKKIITLIHTFLLMYSKIMIRSQYCSI